MDDRLFVSLNIDGLAALIRQAQSSVCYVAPGIHETPALAIAEVAKRFGPSSVTVCLDVDEHVFRMGFGTTAAIDLLRGEGVRIHNAEGLRTGMIVVDRMGFMFAPTALLLEAGDRVNEAPNAMRLSRGQMMEALARLLPATKAMAVAQAETDEERKELLSRELEVPSTEMSDGHFESVEQQLRESPPAQFDVARQVRVYNSRLQYVEISLRGASIHRHRLPIPKVLQAFGSNKELEGRLTTSFELIERDGALSSKAIEDELNELRNHFTRVIDGERLMLKAQEETFKERLKTFDASLKAYREQVEAKLGGDLENSLAAIVSYYLPIVMENPPDAMMGQLPLFDREHAKRWLEHELRQKFPNPEKLLSHMNLEVRYKDLTFQSLNKEGFLEKVQQAFPAGNWDKAYSEFLALGEKARPTS